MDCKLVFASIPIAGDSLASMYVQLREVVKKKLYAEGLYVAAIVMDADTKHEMLSRQESSDKMNLLQTSFETYNNNKQQQQERRRRRRQQQRQQQQQSHVRDVPFPPAGG